jgi:hypothetical protein
MSWRILHAPTDVGGNAFQLSRAERELGYRLGADLRAMIAQRERRLELAAAGRAFVERHHDPRTIARDILRGLAPAAGRPAT